MGETIRSLDKMNKDPWLIEWEQKANLEILILSQASLVHSPQTFNF